MVKRIIQHTFLLSVILPVLLLAPFHRHQHPENADPCCDCVSHQHHSGHITVEGSLSECLICQLLGQVYIPAPILNVSLFSLLLQDGEELIFQAADAASFLRHSPRAPPVSSFFPA